MQKGLVVTSANLKGSQKPIGMPILGIGLPHMQTKLLSSLGVERSLSGFAMVLPAMDNGNKHFQQISVMGLTNLPAHWALAFKTEENASNTNNANIFLTASPLRPLTYRPSDRPSLGFAESQNIS